MICPRCRFALPFLLACLPWSLVCAQFGGSRAGVEDHARGVESLPRLDREIAEGYIAIDGRAEIRVRPSEVRIVLAVTSEGATADECQQTIADVIGRLKGAWGGLEIAPQDIVEDFIAVLPLYQWKLEKRGDVDLGVEERTGFRMQTNVHVGVANDGKATAALSKAFQQGVTDIIAFDYGSRELDDVKNQARAQAVKAALEKSNTLLGPLFEQRPPVINVQELTTIRYPESLYHSFTNSVDQEFTPAWRREVPLIRAARPHNTYYRGLDSDADAHSGELPMRPEISVVSTVRLYFQSPAAKRGENEGEDDE